MLNDNFGVLQGVYCAMFTESWDAGYGKITAAAFGNAQARDTSHRNNVLICYSGLSEAHTHTPTQLTVLAIALSAREVVVRLSMLVVTVGDGELALAKSPSIIRELKGKGVGCWCLK